MPESDTMAGSTLAMDAGSLITLKPSDTSGSRTNASGALDLGDSCVSSKTSDSDSLRWNLRSIWSLIGSASTNQ